MRGAESVRDLITMYEHTPGSLLFGLKGVRAAAAKRDLPQIVQACDKATKAAQEYYNVNAAWERTKNQPKSKGEGDAVALDPLVDRGVTGLQDAAYIPVRSLPKEHPLAIAGRAFLQNGLPNGAEAITKLAHPEELVAVQQLISRCDDPKDLRPHVQTLGLSPFVENLRELSVRFEVALRRPAQGETTWDKVKATSFEAQECMVELVAKIIGTFHLRTPEHIEARTDLLFPIIEQDDRIAEARKQRRPVIDVDPVTGDPVVTPPAGPTGPVEPVNPA